MQHSAPRLVDPFTTHALLLALSAVAAATRREWYHRLVAPAVAVIFAAHVVVLSNRLS